MFVTKGALAFGKEVLSCRVDAQHICAELVVPDGILRRKIINEFDARLISLA
jgi:hypothetical protein